MTVAPPSLRSDQRSSLPRTKSPPVQHQDPIVELKPTATPPKVVEVVPEQAISRKIQRVPCATYPAPPPSPDSYNRESYKDDDDIDSDLPYHDMQNVKWYDSDEDSFASRCPKDKKYSCKMPPTIWLERTFLRFFELNRKSIPWWVMLEIRVDLREEYNILCQARRTAAPRRQAKEGQHCVVERDIKLHDELEYLDWTWRTKVRAEKEKGLVL